MASGRRLSLERCLNCYRIFDLPKHSNPKKMKFCTSLCRRQFHWEDLKRNTEKHGREKLRVRALKRVARATPSPEKT